MGTPEDYFRIRFKPNAARDAVWASIARFLDPKIGIGSGSSVLEIGTGYGSWIRAVSGSRKAAMDLNPDLPRIFEASGIRGVGCHVGSCTDLSFARAGEFDAVLASNVLEHLA